MAHEDPLIPIQSELSTLSRDQRLVYGIASCETMFPSYEAFSAASGFGNPALLRDVLDRIWTCLERPIAGLDFQSLRDRLLTAVPDGQDYPGPLAGVAQNFCICLDVLLQLFLGLASKEADAKWFAVYGLHSLEIVVFSQRPDIRRLDEAAMQAVFGDPRTAAWKQFQLSTIRAARDLHPGDPPDGLESIRSDATTRRLPLPFSP